MRNALAGLALIALLWPQMARSDVARSDVARSDVAQQEAVRSDDAGETAIRAVLAQWTRDFNEGRADRVCDLFSPALRYDYRGFPERGFEDICGLLRRSLADRERRYTYALRIKEVLVSGDLAVVRLVWTLSFRPTGSAKDAVSQEPGLDVFAKQPDGSWKIVRYLAYEE